MPKTTEALLKDAKEEVDTIRAALESLGYLRIEEDKGAELMKLIAELSAKLREREWQDISGILPEEDVRIIGCIIPKITKAGHEVGCYDVRILSTHEDKWNGWVWHRENGDCFFPTHFKPFPTPPQKED